MRKLLYIIEFVAIALFAVWLFSKNGFVSLQWGEYDVQINLLIAFLGMMLLCVALVVGFKLWRGFIFLPQNVKRYMQRSQPEKGLKTLTEGVTQAVLGNDDLAARQMSIFNRQVKDHPLHDAVLGLMHIKRKQFLLAQESVKALSQQKDGKVLARILQSEIHLKQKNYVEAFHELEQLHHEAPKSKRIMSMLLICMTELKLFDRTKSMISKLKDVGALSADQAIHAEALCYMKQALRSVVDLKTKMTLLAKAHKMCPGDYEISAEYIRLLIMHDQMKNATKALQSSWYARPDRRYLGTYLSLKGAADKDIANRDLDKLTASSATHEESLLAIAQHAIDTQQWGRARSHLHTAMQYYPESHHVLHMQALLELFEHGDNVRYRESMEKAYSIALKADTNDELDGILHHVGMNI